MWPNTQKTAALVAFIEEILNGTLHYLCSVCIVAISSFWKWFYLQNNKIRNEFFNILVIDTCQTISLVWRYCNGMLQIYFIACKNLSKKFGHLRMRIFFLKSCFFVSFDWLFTVSKAIDDKIRNAPWF